MAATSGVIQQLLWSGSGVCVALGPTPTQSEFFSTRFLPTDLAWIRDAKKSMMAALAKAKVGGLPVTVGHPDASAEITSVQLAALPDPSQPGSLGFQQVVYAAPGLNYAGTASLSDYVDFDSPSANFATRQFDLSAFAELGSAPWPFANTQVPVNGLLRIPNGSGPFPLVLFAHGNHNAFENSTPGYLYLCDLLASHGILAATIDVNFLNGFNSGENDGRAIVHLEHVRQFRIWHQQAGHPLAGKVDLDRVLIVGHSRGGEGVGHASLFNGLDFVQPDALSPVIQLDGSQGLGPYHFGLRAVAAIAPTDGQYVPVGGPTEVPDNYYLIHGSGDGDVFPFPGFKTFDRSHAVDLADPEASSGKFKALSWVHGANHNFFNSVWGVESGSAATLTRAQQEQVAKVQLSALAQATLLGVRAYMDLLRDHALGETEGWLPAAASIVSEYQDPERLLFQHSEEPGAAIVVSAPATGTVDTSQVAASKLGFDLGVFSHLFEETAGLRLVWNTAGRRYRIQLDPASLAPGVHGFLAFRIGQSFEANNPAGVDQAFTLILGDGASTASFASTSIQKLIFPSPGTRGADPKTVMQTFRLPLRELRAHGLEPLELRELTLECDETPSGTLYLDDLQLTR